MLYRRIAVLLLAACAVTGIVREAFAQERYLEIAARHNRASVFHRAIILPDGDARKAVVTFRIPNSLLVFMQEKAGFEAQVELTVELYRKGQKIDDRIFRRRHSVPTFDATQSRTDDLEGWVQFDVEPGDYAYRLLVNDEGADERGTARGFSVPAAGDVVNGSLVFGDLRIDSAGVAIEAANLGGDVPFGGNLSAVVPVAVRPQEGTVLSYQLYRLSPSRTEAISRRSAPRRSRRDDRVPEPPEPIEIQPGDELLTSGSVDAADLVPVGAFRGADAECLCWTKPSTAASALAVIPIQTDRLENATYVLDVTSKAAGDTKKYVFGTHWRDMPLSLYDIEVAIRNLEFIEKRDVIRTLLKGSREQQVDAFQAYWKERDPTPNTVTNELMEEYYRRVDHAAMAFRTGQHPLPDGLRTDPARIYILFGEPDRVSNTLPASGGVKQTWTYADGRTFVFWAASSLVPMELVN